MRDIGDVRLAMDGSFGSIAQTSEPRVPQPRALPWVVAIVAGLVTGLAVWSLMRSEAPLPERTKRLAITLPSEAELATSGGTFFALSRDGADLVYIGEGEAARQLFRRPMDQLDVVPIRDTAGASRPFFSPDGAWLGFFTDRGLEKVSLSGGPATTICDDPICDAASSRGGSWMMDGRIVFGAARGGLSIVSAAGGDPQSLTAPEVGMGQNYPVVMPDERAILFTSVPGSVQRARVAIYVFSSGEVRELFEGALPRFTSGHILFAREDSLWAVAFDEDALEPRGNPFLVQEDVARPNTTVQFQVAEDGTLVYMPQSGFAAPAPVWMDREGRQKPIPIPEDSYRSVRLSPDGTRLALQEFQLESDLWVYDLARGTISRLTTDPTQDLSPLWTLDGRRVVFGSERLRSCSKAISSRNSGAEPMTSPRTDNAL